MSKQTKQRGLIDAALSGGMAVTIDRRSGALKHQIVNERIARSGVASDRLGSIIDIADVRHSADIQQSNLSAQSARHNQSAMECRNDGGALASGRDVGGAKIIGDVDAEPRRQRLAVSDLNGQPLLGPVQNRLAMETDDVDACPINLIFAQKRLDSLGMSICDHAFGKRQDARARRPVFKRRGFRERGAKKRAIIVAIGIKTSRTEVQSPFAVGFDKSRVHPIHRGAGHQAYGAVHGQPESPVRMAKSIRLERRTR